MHEISWLPALGKLCLGLCSTISGGLTLFILASSMFFSVRAIHAMQSPYDYRQDDHLRTIDDRDKAVDAERKERRAETLKARADDEGEILNLEKLVAAMAPAVVKIDDIHDRQIRDEAYVGGALGIIGVIQFYLNNKDKMIRKKLDKRYTRKPYDHDEEETEDE